MPQYRIELRTDERIWETSVIERADVRALRVEIARFVGELLREHAEQIWVDQEWRVDVTDESGLILYVMNLFATDSPALRQPRR